MEDNSVLTPDKTANIPQSLNLSHFQWPGRDWRRQSNKGFKVDGWFKVTPNPLAPLKAWSVLSVTLACCDQLMDRWGGGSGGGGAHDPLFPPCLMSKSAAQAVTMYYINFEVLSPHNTRTQDLFATITWNQETFCFIKLQHHCSNREIHLAAIRTQQNSKYHTCALDNENIQNHDKEELVCFLSVLWLRAKWGCSIGSNVLKKLIWPL